MRAPDGVPIFVPDASLLGWRLTRVDVKIFSLQTGSAELQVYVIPPRESANRYRFLWVLNAVSYGLVQANGKIQFQAENLLIEHAMTCMIYISLMFYLKQMESSPRFWQRFWMKSLLKDLPTIWPTF